MWEHKRHYTESTIGLSKSVFPTLTGSRSLEFQACWELPFCMQNRCSTTEPYYWATVRRRPNQHMEARSGSSRAQPLSPSTGWTSPVFMLPAQGFLSLSQKWYFFWFLAYHKSLPFSLAPRWFLLVGCNCWLCMTFCTLFIFEIHSEIFFFLLYFLAVFSCLLSSQHSSPSG